MKLFESADEIMETIVYDRTEEKQAAFYAHDPLVVVSDSNNHTREWYIALYIDDNNDGTMRVDHVEIYPQYCDNEWQHPPNDDIQEILPEQTVPGAVERMWEFTRDTAVFKLFNIADINIKFEELFQRQIIFVLNQFPGLNSSVLCVQI